METCPNCSHPVFKDNVYCLHCGKLLKSNNPRAMWIIRIVLVAGLILPVLVVAALNFVSNGVSTPPGQPTAEQINPVSTPTQPPTRTPLPEFVIMAQDPDQSTDAECIICRIADWEGPKEPGVYEWQVSFPADKSALLTLGWCAVDQATLDANWSQMSYELFIDGYRVELSQLPEEAITHEDRVCYVHSGVLTGWSIGRHSYVWIHHLYAGVDDGWDYYKPGDYLMEFKVEVQ